MKNIRFLYENLFDDATVTASSEASGFPVERTQNELYLKAWRSTGDTAEWLKWDCAAAVELSYFMAKGHNFRLGQSVYFAGNATDDWGAPSFNQQIEITQDMVDNNLIYLDTSLSPKTYRWWRLYLDDASNPDGYFRIGRPYGGSYFEPGKNFSFVRPKNYKDPSTLHGSSGGQYFANVKTKYSEFEYAFVGLSETDKESFEEMWEDLGITVPFFIVEDADEAPDRVLYVRMMDFKLLPISKIWDSYGAGVFVRIER